jgi:DNA-binding NtrC family response regulator
MNETPSPKARILVADDEAPQREILSRILSGEGYEVITAPDGSAASELLRSAEPDVLLTDMKMPEMDGMALLEFARREAPRLPVILLTAFGSVPQAIAAVRAGAFDFLTKPLDRDALLIAIGRAAAQSALRRENEALRAALGEKFRFGAMVGEHPAMQAVYATLAKVAASPATLLIVGESGTGKEMVAKAVHYNSPRAGKPFVAVNCAAIPEGLIESELFGHEKGAFTGAVERKRGGVRGGPGGDALSSTRSATCRSRCSPSCCGCCRSGSSAASAGNEKLKADVRIVAASNQRLEEQVAHGRFRQDLYYRLNVIIVSLPPLRERQSDIPRLAAHFLAKYAGSAAGNGPPKTLAPAALKKLIAYPWPGNVRQLEAVIERTILLSDGPEITVEDLPVEVRENLIHPGGPRVEIPPEGLDLEAYERAILLKAFESCGRNVSRAARLLKLTRRTMQYRLQKVLGDQPELRDEDEPRARVRTRARVTV